MHKTALDIRIKLFGKTHVKVGETMLDLGKVFEEWGYSDEVSFGTNEMHVYVDLIIMFLVRSIQAIAVYDQAITTFNKIPNSDFRALASAYSRLGTLFEKNDNLEASLHSWKKALEIYTSKSGRDSIVAGEILYSVGKIYHELGNLDKSVSCFSEAVKILRPKVEDNDMIGQALGHIGRNYARKKQYARAIELCTESLRLQKQFSEARHIAESLLELGNILKAWGKADQAMQFFEEALRTFEEAYGTNAVEAANCRFNLGTLNEQLGNSQTALRYFGEALRVYRTEEGDNSLNVASSLFQIGQIYDSYGKKDKALKCFEESLSIRHENLGDDHLDVLAAQRFVNLINRKMKHSHKYS
jgi:tetratricopeptide (TPR) repeat protein